MQADVVIIGAGLAGLSAANEIAAHSGATVIVIERHVIGSNNPTPMTFADVPERFGLQDCVIGCYDRFTFHSPLGNRSVHQYQETALVALAYRQACLSLLDRASTAGNVWEYSAAATRLVRNGKSWLVGLNDGVQIDTPLVIDASGRGLFSSRALGLSSPQFFSHVYGARLSGCDIPNHQEAFFFAPHPDYGDGGGWLYPLKDRQVSFGYATLGKTPQLPGRQVKENFQRALAGFQPYSRWLEGAHWDHVEVGSIPLFPVQRFVYDGLMIAGDAAGQATIWSCMGSAAALEAGQMAGHAAVQGLKYGDFSASRLQSYQTHWDNRYRQIYRANGLIAPTVWGMTAEQWNEQISRVQELTPDQMLARLQVNWPVPTLPQAVFVRTYDLAGRARRKISRQVRSLFLS